MENIVLVGMLYNNLRNEILNTMLYEVINPFNLESIFELDAELYEELLIDL